MLIEWSRISALMLSTVRGMWHSTQELPVLRFGMVRMRADIFGQRFVAAGAQRVGIRTQLRIPLDLRLVRRHMAVHAGDLAFEEALALP